MSSDIEYQPLGFFDDNLANKEASHKELSCTLNASGASAQAISGHLSSKSPEASVEEEPEPPLEEARAAFAEAAAAAEAGAARGDLADNFRQSLPPFRVRLSGGSPEISEYLRSFQRKYRPKFRPFDISVENYSLVHPTSPDRGSPGNILSFLLTPLRRLLCVGSFCEPYSVHRPLLHDINFVAKSGEMVLLLGASGAGSSLLMEKLSGRTPRPSSTHGQMLFNGVPLFPPHARRDVAFVRQTDVHTPLLTVAESLDFAIAMQMPTSVPSELHRERRDMILDMLRLRGVTNSLVGSTERRGISGGERRRLSVGLEMGRIPGCYLLDEPSTGIDAPATFWMCHGFRGVAQSGPPVLMALKQPALEVAALFDRVVVLTPGGGVAFVGTIGEGLRHYADLGYECPHYVNPADFFLDVLENPARYAVSPCAETPEDEDEEAAKKEKEEEKGGILLGTWRADPEQVVNQTLGKWGPERVIPREFFAVASKRTYEDFEEAFRQSRYFEKVRQRQREVREAREEGLAQKVERAEEIFYIPRFLRGVADPFVGWIQRRTIGARPQRMMEHMYFWEGRYARGMLSQLRWALWRGLIVLRRDRIMLIMKAIRTLLTGLLVGTLFLQLDNNQHDSRLVAAFLFFTITFYAFSSMASLPAIYLERAVLYRDLDAHYSRALPYLISSVTVNLSAVFLELFIYNFLAYFLVGLSLMDMGWRFVYFFIATALLSLNSDAFARLVSSLCPSLGLASTLDPLFDMMAFIFAGYLLPRGDIRPWFIWLHYCNPVMFAFFGLMINQFSDQDLECDASELVPPKNDPRYALDYPVGFQRQQMCPMTEGAHMLDAFDIDAHHEQLKWWFLLPLFGFWVIFLALAYVGFSFVRWKPSIKSTREPLTRKTSLQMGLVWAFTWAQWCSAWAFYLVFGWLRTIFPSKTVLDEEWRKRVHQAADAGRGTTARRGARPGDDDVEGGGDAVEMQPMGGGRSFGGGAEEVDPEEGNEITVAMMIRQLVGLEGLTKKAAGERGPEEPPEEVEEPKTYPVRILDAVERSFYRRMGAGEDAEFVERRLRCSSLKHLTENRVSGGFLSWSKVHYRVRSGLPLPFPVPHLTKSHHLLRGVSGYVVPGMNLALMGPSGAGKTTLLDVLAQRKTTGHISGDFRFNGAGLPRNFRRHIGYAEQSDVHEPTATVQEAVQFAALTRMSAGYLPVRSTSRKLRWATHVLHAMRLYPLRHRKVGSGHGDGITGEQRKRLTVAVELAANPSIIFCDEPTSGLDAVGAVSVMDVLNSIAHSGRSVVCTVHQPSVAVFAAFTHVCLLGKGGSMVYFGRVHDDNVAKDFGPVLRFFGRCGFECPPQTNPADFVLSVISDGRNSLSSFSHQEGNAMQTASAGEEGVVSGVEESLVGQGLPQKKQGSGPRPWTYDREGLLESFLAPFAKALHGHDADLVERYNEEVETWVKQWSDKHELELGREDADSADENDEPEGVPRDGDAAFENTANLFSQQHFARAYLAVHDRLKPSDIRSRLSVEKQLEDLRQLRDAGDSRYGFVSAAFWASQFNASEEGKEVRRMSRRNRAKLLHEENRLVRDGPFWVLLLALFGIGSGIRTYVGSKSIPGFVQFFLVLMREILRKWRNPLLILVRIVAQVAMGIMLGLVFFQEDDDQAGLNGRVSVLFMTVLFSVVMTVPVSAEVVMERSLVFRERLAGSYGYFSYCLRLILVEVVLNIIYSALMILPLYYMVGLRPGFQYLLYLFTVSYLTTLLSISYGHFIGVIMPNATVSTEVVTTTLSLSMTFAGFFISRSSMGDRWGWASWLSFFSYALEASYVTQFRDFDFFCRNNEYLDVPVVVTNKVVVGNHSEYVTRHFTKEFCYYENGDQWIDQFDYDDPTAIWRSPVILVCYCSLFIILTNIFIRLVKQIKR